MQTPPVTLEQAMDLADHASPAPWIASQALKAMRAEIERMRSSSDAHGEAVAWMSYSAATGKPVFDTAPPDEPNVAGWRPLGFIDHAECAKGQGISVKTLDDVRTWHVFKIGRVGQEGEPHAAMISVIDSHLARQSEGVSESDVMLVWHTLNAACDEGAFPTPDDVRAALTAVLHNRPAQEKAEPVAIGKIDEGESGMFVELYPDRDLPLGAEVYIAPPAERVRVPDGWKLAPSTIPLDEHACRLLRNQIEPADGEICPLTFFVGDATEDDGKVVHGLHFFDPEYPEEGVITIARFIAAAPEVYHG